MSRKARVIPDKRRSRADPGSIPEPFRSRFRNGSRVSAALRPGRRRVWGRWDRLPLRVILDKPRYAAQAGIHPGAGPRPVMDPGRPAAAQDDGGGSVGMITSAARQNPRPARAAGFRTNSPERGWAEPGGARIKAACRCRVSMSRCRCSADLAPPGSARGDFGRRGRSSLAKGLPTARPPVAPARDGDASRNPPPHPAARCLATAPLVGCSAGKVRVAGIRGACQGYYCQQALGRG